MPSRSEIEQAFVARRRLLWGLCYRLTGVAADADELLQETFLRAIERPPRDADADWERWLVRVATNLSLDRLRARRRRSYVGAWLPSPLETVEVEGVGDEGVALGYERMESVSYALLVALEVLGPKARAVLILCDMFDYSAADVATLLGMSEGNVRVLHHRARGRVAAVHPAPRPWPEVAIQTRIALQAFMECLIRQDVKGIEALLTESVRTITDGGGEYTALRAPLVGIDRVVRFHLETARRRGPISRLEMRSVNGLPAFCIETAAIRPQMAPRVVLRCELDAAGRICELHAILASRKLTAVGFSRAPD